MQIPNAKIKKLENGITLAVEEISSLRSVSMGLIVNAGSEIEDKDLMGISHFIEHTTFKGTNKRSAMQIAQELDSVGGKLNAFTGKEFTQYYAVIQDKYIDVAADVLSDIFLNSKYDDKDIDMEKNVVLEEIKMYEDSPDEHIHDIFTLAVIPNHPLGNPVIGEEKTVRSINSKKILDFRKNYYTPDNLLISIAGNVSFESASTIITDKFSSFKGNSSNKMLPSAETVQTIKLKSKKTEQVHLIIGSKGPSQNNDERFAFTVMDNILGGSMSSRLFQEIREKRGLAYSIYSFNQGFKDIGLFEIYAGTRKENFENVVELIMKELTKMRKIGLSKEELERAKEFIKGTMVLSLESSNSRMNYMARSIYYHGRVVTIEEIFEKIDRVGLDDIMKLTEKYLSEKDLSLVVIGDFDKLPITKLT